MDKNSEWACVAVFVFSEIANTLCVTDMPHLNSALCD